MKKSTARKHFSFILLMIFLCLLAVSCFPAGKKQTCHRRLTENLHLPYSAEIDFSVNCADTAIVGKARLFRDGAFTTLEILSPEPYSQLTVDYDVTGAPSAVTVHFSGIDVALPAEALSKINTLACLAFDDYLSALAQLPAEEIRDYSESGELMCVSLSYMGADTLMVFDSEKALPQRFEYSSEELCATVNFTKFKLDISEF